MSTKTTPGQRVAELLRELAMRKRVYPNWIDNHRNKRKPAITAEDAAHRIAVVEETIEDLYTLYPALRPTTQASLFGIDEARKLPPQHLDRP